MNHSRGFPKNSYWNCSIHVPTTKPLVCNKGVIEEQDLNEGKNIEKNGKSSHALQQK